MKTATGLQPTFETHAPTEASRDDATELIVVGVDGSANARRAGEWAAAYASTRGAEVLVVHAWSLPAVRRAEVLLAFSIKELEAAAAQVLLAESRNLRQQFPDVRIQSRLSYGEPSRVLLDAARGADSVVVGSRGAGRIARLFFGSVSQAMTTQARCPVVVVRGPAPDRCDLGASDATAGQTVATAITPYAIDRAALDRQAA